MDGHDGIDGSEAWGEGRGRRGHRGEMNTLTFDHIWLFTFGGD